VWKKRDGTMEVYFYLPDGRLVATYQRIWRWGPEYPNEWCLRRVGERVWFAGTLLTVDGERVYTDRLGSVVRRGTHVYRYYPHGEPFGTNPVTTGPHFATYERDQVAGLDQAWNRGYLPTYGRFAQADPYQASGGAADPGSWNRYAYVGGDPVNFYDPPGLFMAVPQPNGPFLGHWIPNAGGFPIGGGGAPEIEVRETEEASGGGTSPEDVTGFLSSKITTKAQAREWTIQAVINIAERCFKKIGITRSKTLAKAQDIMYFDGRPSEDGSVPIARILGPDLEPRLGETFNSVSYGANAVILRYKSSGDISRYVVLGANFFGRTATDQGITLAHEVFHYATGLGDRELGRLAGYTGKDFSAASEAFSAWLKAGCP
jgi:RHS repeat-associated protein